MPSVRHVHVDVQVLHWAFLVKYFPCMHVSEFKMIADKSSGMMRVFTVTINGIQETSKYRYCKMYECQKHHTIFPDIETSRLYVSYILIFRKVLPSLAVSTEHARAAYLRQSSAALITGQLLPDRKLLH